MIDIKIINDNNLTKCEICNRFIENDYYDNIESNNYNIYLDCGHCVHYHCLYTLEKYNCPCCNKGINKKFILEKKNKTSLLERFLSNFF